MSEQEELLDEVRRRFPLHTEPEPAQSTTVVLPFSGEIIDRRDIAQCARALEDIRDLVSKMNELKGWITEAVVEESRRQGTKTLHLPDGHKVEVRGGERTIWDAQQLEQDLRAAGMPEERIREIVVEEVSWTVSAAKANQAARANPAYGEAVGRARSTVETRPTIAIKA